MIKIFTAKDKNKIERDFNEWEAERDFNEWEDERDFPRIRTHNIISLHWAITDNSSDDDKPPYQSLLVHYE